MGFISRKILPACGRMCVCCPALHPSSRRPTKRYKKLLADIFPKTVGDRPNERKIMKLCEYAAKNPFRIPKIAMKLEQRSNKDLRIGHVSNIFIIAETYCKFLYVCKGQMVYYARSLLDFIQNLLNDKKQEGIIILGCQTLTTFIYSQADSTYMQNIEKVVNKVCLLARATAEPGKGTIQTASLKCLSAMIWYMTEYSHIFANFDEIIYATLDSYVKDGNNDHVRQKSPHHWVDEVVRHEARGGSIELGISLMTARSQSEMDASFFTRKENETPEVWAHICIEKLAEMAKESTTMRRVLEPMFAYFDSGKHWNPQHGLALLVLHDFSYFLKASGNVQLVLSFVVRHLDHKIISHDPKTKCEIVQITTYLAQHLRLQAVTADIGIVNDLCNHLTKSLQAMVELVGREELDLNLSLQNSIHDCLLEIAKGISDASPLLDMMTIALEALPQNALVARATIGSLLVLAHIISLSCISSHPQMIFPDTLLVQLLQAMLHTDVETRVGAHQIFSTILVGNLDIMKHELEISYDRGQWQSKTSSIFASATALLEKLRREEYINARKNGNDAFDAVKFKNTTEEEGKQAMRSSPPYFYRGNLSLIEKAVTSNTMQEKSIIIALTEDQIAQLLSVFWNQAIKADNFPSNYEAIAHSMSWILVSARLKSSDPKITVNIFQLLLSLISASLDVSEKLSPSSQRSLFTLATGMLSFAGKIYNIPLLMEVLDNFSSIVDPFLRVGDDAQLYVQFDANLMDFGSAIDQRAALSSLFTLRKKMAENEMFIIGIIAEALSRLTDMDGDELYKELSKQFMPDDGSLFCSKVNLDGKVITSLPQLDEVLSIDEECSRSSATDAVDLVSIESSATRTSRSNPKPHELQSFPHVLSVGQLLESALEAAGQVAGTAVSTSPLPYSAVANHCEALGMGTRKKLSSWLGPNAVDSLDANKKTELDRSSSNVSDRGDGAGLPEPWQLLRLPPSSPFDNFMRAAGWQEKERLV